MDTYTSVQTVHIPTKFHSLIYNELSNMPLREVYLIWEMIRAMKQTHPKQTPQKRAKFNFERSQTLLKNIKGSLAEDIINIEREDRI